MKKNKKSKAFVGLPMVLSLAAVYFKSVWLVIATVFLIFLLVSILPFCRKRENLWLFLLSVTSFIPINCFLVITFDSYVSILFSDPGTGFIYWLTIFEYSMIMTGVEEIMIGSVGRMLFKRQYRLHIPEVEE